MRLNTPDDLAEMFGKTPRRIVEWANEHGWPCIRVGHTIRFTDEQVAQILAKHTKKADAGAIRPLIEGQTKRSAARS